MIFLNFVLVGSVSLDSLSDNCQGQQHKLSHIVILSSLLLLDAPLSVSGAARPAP